MRLVLSNDLFNMEALLPHKLNKMDASYARLLKAARELRDADNPAKVARLLHISDQTIQNWKTRGVPVSKLVEIEKKIGATPKWIATGEGSMVPTDMSGQVTKDQEKILALINSIDKEARDALLKMITLLVRRPPEIKKEDTINNLGGGKYADKHDMSGYTLKTPDEAGQSDKRRKQK